LIAGAGLSQNDVPDCIGCTRIVRLAPGELDRILSDYRRANGGSLVDESVRQQRLAVCQACPDLLYGTTCRHCGCLVEVRASVGKNACPAPVARWAAVANANPES